MSSTETISLEALPHDPNISNPSKPTIEGPLSSSNFDPANPDAIIAASRLADAEVPDGGYGWVSNFSEHRLPQFGHIQNFRCFPRLKSSAKT